MTKLDPPGFLDRLAECEEAMPQWQEIIATLAQELELVAGIMREATQKIENQPARIKPFIYRRELARQLARDLRGPADRIYEQGQMFASQVPQIDAGIRTVLDQVPREYEGSSPEEKEALRRAVGSIRGLSSAMANSEQGIGGMINSLAVIEGLSRDLRPVARRMAKGLKTTLAAGAVSTEWQQQVLAAEESMGVSRAVP